MNLRLGRLSRLGSGALHLLLLAPLVLPSQTESECVFRARSLAVSSSALMPTRVQTLFTASVLASALLCSVEGDFTFQCLGCVGCF